MRRSFNFPRNNNKLSFPALGYLDWCQWHGLLIITKAIHYRSKADFPLMLCTQQDYNDVISIPEKLRYRVLNYGPDDRKAVIQLRQESSHALRRKWENSFSQEDDAEFGEQARRTATLVGIGAGLGCAVSAYGLAYCSGALKEESSTLPTMAFAGAALTGGFFAGRSAIMRRMEIEKRMRIDRKHDAMADFYGGMRSLYDPQQTVFEE